MTDMTTIKVPVELRERISKLARSRHTTIVGAVERAIDAEETEAFWEEVRATMSTAEARADIIREAEERSGTIRHGLGHEAWSDIL